MQAMLSVCPVDFLHRMQLRLERYTDDGACIMNALGVKDQKRRCAAFGQSCKECIAAWLNEEENA